MCSMCVDLRNVGNLKTGPKAGGGASSSDDFADYAQVDMLGVRYKSVNFGA